MKNSLINFTLIISSLIFTALCCEIFLRFMPVNQGFSFQPVNSINTVLRSKPERRLVQKSKYWNMLNPHLKEVNEAGFVNHSVYLTKKERKDKPMLAVVGDSFVQAVEVDDKDTFFAILDQSTSIIDVYSFGFGGAGLSQYLIWARHAKKTFDNDYLIINIVGNDFDESLKKYKVYPGFYHYDINDSGKLELVRCDWNSSIYGKIISKSSLVRYLFSNVGMMNVVLKIRTRFFTEKNAFVGNVSAEVSDERENDSYKAIDAFFRDLPSYSGLQPKNILFVMDGFRVYDEDRHKAAKKSYFGKMRLYFFKKAKQLGYEYIDMDVNFDKNYSKNKKKFEFSFDAHWNELGHQVVASSIMESALWKNISLSKNTNVSKRVNNKKKLTKKDSHNFIFNLIGI